MRITGGKTLHYYRTVFANQKRLETQVDVAWPSNFRFDVGVYLDNDTFEISLGFFNISLNRRCDHAGLELELALPFLIAELRFVDNRHWNYKTKDWEKYYGEGDE